MVTKHLYIVQNWSQLYIILKMNKLILYYSKYKHNVHRTLKCNQGNQDSSRNKNNVIQGQRPDMKKGYTQQRTYNNQNNTYKVTKVNEQPRLL